MLRAGFGNVELDSDLLRMRKECRDKSLDSPTSAEVVDRLSAEAFLLMLTSSNFEARSLTLGRDGSSS